MDALPRFARRSAAQARQELDGGSPCRGLGRGRPGARDGGGEVTSASDVGRRRWRGLFTASAEGVSATALTPPPVSRPVASWPFTAVRCRPSTASLRISAGEGPPLRPGTSARWAVVPEQSSVGGARAWRHPRVHRAPPRHARSTRGSRQGGEGDSTEQGGAGPSDPRTCARHACRAATHRQSRAARAIASHDSHPRGSHLFHVKPRLADAKPHVETRWRHRNVSRETAMLAAT